MDDNIKRHGTLPNNMNVGDQNNSSLRTHAIPSNDANKNMVNDFLECLHDIDCQRNRSNQLSGNVCNFCTSGSRPESEQIKRCCENPSELRQNPGCVTRAVDSTPAKAAAALKDYASVCEADQQSTAAVQCTCGASTSGMTSQRTSQVCKRPLTNALRPDKLPALPQIYVSTTDKSLRRLYPTDLKNNGGIAGGRHSSLPNLTLPEGELKSAACHLTGLDPKSENSLSVFCSPRVPRRLNKGRNLVEISPKNDKGEGGQEFCWLDTFDPSRHVRRYRIRHNSRGSGDSDKLTSTPSHPSLSTLSEPVMPTSCTSPNDQLSLPTSPSRQPLGKLRRIWSTPNQPVHNPTYCCRGIQSCCDLKNANTPSVCHQSIELKLPYEGAQLLSPPPVIPPIFIKTLKDGNPPPLTFEQMYDAAYRAAFVDADPDSEMSSEHRVRQWLFDPHFMEGPGRDILKQ